MKFKRKTNEKWRCKGRKFRCRTRMLSTFSRAPSGPLDRTSSRTICATYVHYPAGNDIKSGFSGAGDMCSVK
eukprot:1385268-Amorphochlora_amoeboformis.AAC.1